MDVWFGLGVGVFIGGIVGLIIFLLIVGTWYVGDLREDKSTDEERPYYFMEVAKGASRQIQKNRFVLLRIKRENYVK